MEANEKIEELVQRLISIENEIKLLQEDRNQLFSEFKDQVDIKAFKAAVRLAKIKLRLGDSEPALDDMLVTVENKIVT